MNRGTIKVQEKGRCADHRDNEVDGHLLAGEKNEDLGVVEGGFCRSSWRSRAVSPLGK